MGFIGKRIQDSEVRIQKSRVVADDADGRRSRQIGEERVGAE
jgi:hypothetical protein